MTVVRCCCVGWSRVKGAAHDYLIVGLDEKDF